MLKTKLFVGVAALALVAVVAIPASAATTAELTAQINALLAQIAQLQSQVGSSSTATTATTFTSDLTVGSTGTEVTALQQFLVAGGYMTAPASYGYFGAMTKAALVKYQTAMGITPASGYFGPLTRAKVNGSSTTTTGGKTTTTVSTTGEEGTMSVTLNNSGVKSTVYEGDSKVAILGFKVEANDSDIAVQRVKLDLGTATTIYRKVYEKVYVTVDDEVLASKELDASTVTKDGGRYYVTLADFSYVVSKDETAKFFIKADVRSSIDSTYQTSHTVRLASNGVRGVDGAGIDQYAGDTSITKAVTVSGELAEDATLKLSLDSDSPEKQDVVATEGSTEDEYNGLPVLTFGMKASKDDVKVTDLVIGVSEANSTSYADAVTAYLYEGSTEIDSAAVTSGYATFSDIDYTVTKDETSTLTVKLDVADATSDREAFTVSASSTGVIAENSSGDTVTASGSATGYAIGVTNVGPVITLNSKSVTTDGVPQGSGSNANATSTLTATFNVKIQAVGDDIVLGNISSSTYPVFDKINSFKVYKDGVASTVTGLATSTSYTVPPSCATISGQNSCTLSDGQSVTFAVTYQIYGRSATTGAISSGIYAIGLEKLYWQYGGAIKTTSFMAGEEDWRTDGVSFP